MKPYQDITDPTVAKALAHPLRTRILSALADRTASPSELAAELDVPLGVLSYHVRRLTALGFLKLVRRVPRRGAVEHYYTATVRPRVTDEAWGATPAVVKQAHLDAALTQIGSDVAAAAASGGFDVSDARVSRLRAVVDEQGWRELARELDQLAERVGKIEEDSRARLATTRASGQQSPVSAGEERAVSAGEERPADAGEERAAAIVQMLFAPRPGPR